MKLKKLEAIKDIYKLSGEASDKLQAIATVAANSKNKVLAIFLDPNLNLDEKIIAIQESVKITEKNIRKYRKYAQLIGTLCLVIYTFLQTIGLI